MSQQHNQQGSMIFSNSEDKLDAQEGNGSIAGGLAAPPQFPLRLHDMLDQAEIEGYQHIVSWLPGGNGFQIHDSEAMLPILQKFGFNQSRYKSFLRQLQNYGYRREIRGPQKGKCTHELFVQGRRELCHNMRRIKKSTSAETMNHRTIQRRSPRDHGIVSQAIALSEEENDQMYYGRAALSAPSLLLQSSTARRFPSTVDTFPSARMNMYANQQQAASQSTRNASFDFFPPPPSRTTTNTNTNTMMVVGDGGHKVEMSSSQKSRHVKGLLFNEKDELIWDIQKELSKVDSQKMPSQDVEPRSFRSSSPSLLPTIVDGMNELEVNETMCSIFLEEPSLEETYDS